MMEYWICAKKNNDVSLELVANVFRWIIVAHLSGLVFMVDHEGDIKKIRKILFFFFVSPST